MTKIILSAAIALLLLGGGAQAHAIKKSVYVNTSGPGGIVIGKTVKKKTCVTRHHNHVHRNKCRQSIKVRPVVVIKP